MTFTIALFKNLSTITRCLRCVSNLNLPTHGCAKLKVFCALWKSKVVEGELQKPAVAEDRCVFLSSKIR